MKILLLSITAGQGHHQTAKAVADFFIKNSHEAIVLDCYEYLNPMLKEAVSSGYLVSTKYTPKLWGKFYTLMEKYDEYDPFVRGANHIMSKSLLKYIDEYNPDVVICSHVFACLLMTYAKRKRPDIPVVGILTDFRLHPYFEGTDIDYYVIPNEYLKYSVCEKGIPEEKILPFGIPIMDKFMKSVPRSEARKNVGMEDENTILVMGGSMGFGNMIKTLKQVDKLTLPFQMVIVCGNNGKLYKKVQKTEFSHKVYSYGYVSNVDELMDCADCIITKPGGLTSSEALAKRLPIILSKPIPGQEDRNSEFLLNFGCAMKISKTLTAEELVCQFFQNPDRIKTVIDNIELIRKPNAVKDLYDFVVNLVENNEKI